MTNVRKLRGGMTVCFSTYYKAKKWVILMTLNLLVRDKKWLIPTSLMSANSVVVKWTVPSSSIG